MQVRKIEFWYDFASTYSYLSAMRIETLATRAGLTVEWKPFLLGPIFQAQGWTNSPFNIYPAKGKYMWRDMARLAADRGLPLRTPDPFPQNSLLAARIALVGAEQGWIAPSTREVYRAEFVDGANLSEPATLAAVLARLDETRDLDLASIHARAGEAEIKDRLKQQTADALRLGIFGAPTFRVVPEESGTAPRADQTNGEIFWGDDRLEQAIRWSTR